MYYEYKQYVKKVSKREYSDFIMGIDTGGTNTRITISGVKKNMPIMLFSMYYKSREVTSIESLIKQVTTYSMDTFNIKVLKACIAGAGPVSHNHDFCKLTNLDWSIDAKEILKKTQLKQVLIINDFEAVGYGIAVINHKDKKQIEVLKKGEDAIKKDFHPTIAVLGAGTGLGKATLIYNKKFESYIPVASEGGHADLPAHDETDVELIDFIKEQRKFNKEDPADYEDVLSGPGLVNIYKYLTSRGDFEATEFTRKVDQANDMAEFISAYRDEDKTCSKVFELFARYFGRAAKNFALDSLPRGGLFIAGNISVKNKDMFKSADFIKEFLANNKQKDLLEKIPIFLILNNEINVYGACYAAIIRDDLATKKK